MMFLEDALCNIKAELMTLGLFNVFYEYAELVPHPPEKYPEVYIGKGNYKPIYDFDVNGAGYIRKNGEVRINIVQDKNFIVTSCETFALLDVDFPLRLVAAIPKKKLSDNKYSDDQLAIDLIDVLHKEQTAIIGVNKTWGTVTSYDTDRDLVWLQEVTGIENTVKLDLSFIAINFKLTFRATADCIKRNCSYA